MMRQFSDNFKKYKEENSFSDADIAELCELDVSDVEMMNNLTDEFINKDTVQRLCVSLDIDYSSVCSPKGFTIKPLLKQYLDAPHDFQVIVTRALIHNIDDYMNCNASNYVYPMHYSVLGRFRNGSAALTESNLADLKHSVTSSCMNEDDYEEIFAKCLFNKVPNYNFIQLKDYHDLKFEVISDKFGLAKSTTAGWAGKRCSTIPEDKLFDLCRLFNVDKSKFLTCIFNKNDLRNSRCSLGKEAIIDSRPHVKDLLVDIETMDKIDNGLGSVYKPNAQSYLSRVQPVHSSPSSLDTLSIFISDEKLILKMYKMLSDTSKSKVNNLIIELFKDDDES